MTPITLEQQLSVATKVYHANEALQRAYPGTRRIVTLKTDRAGMAVYVHSENLQVEKLLSVDPVEYFSTVDAELAAIHAALDDIINECNDERTDLFFGGVVRDSQKATA